MTGYSLPCAAWLAGADVDVTVVSLPGHLATRLQFAARNVTLLPVAAVAATGSRKLMAEGELDLISMADIARLAGQSRATVGNWKSRNPEDFPPERGRGSRGPLYDRAEATAWLEATNRLDKRSAEVAAVWRLADQLRDGMRTEDTMPLLLLLLAVMSKAPGSEWQRVLKAQPEDLDKTLRDLRRRAIPLRRRGHAVRQASGPVGRPSHRHAVQPRPPPGRRHGRCPAGAGRQGIGSSWWRVPSPPSVRRLVVAIAEPTGTVYNPAAGVGQLMIDAAANTTSKPVHLVGQEINRRTWAMAQLNLAIHDVDADVALGDVFGEDHFPQLRADRVISVPPWGQKLPLADVSPTTLAGCGVSPVPTMATRHGFSTAFPTSPMTVER